ncbi:hypothetical protein SAMN06297251_10717 [Fulvimarina manganoxydans]|uniref:Uncharacterized protein n=1 Tax=Fulvimarina manganoxydans TaxID=937218 RepID=A0A1W2BNS2_9HYPH|nr:hypothetical protein SAMN06297251_10717 [Fulvimarina manganoxydans]
MSIKIRGSALKTARPWLVAGEKSDQSIQASGFQIAQLVRSMGTLHCRIDFLEVSATRQRCPKRQHPPVGGTGGCRLSEACIWEEELQAPIRRGLGGGGPRQNLKFRGRSPAGGGASERPKIEACDLGGGAGLSSPGIGRRRSPANRQFCRRSSAGGGADERRKFEACDLGGGAGLFSPGIGRRRSPANRQFCRRSSAGGGADERREFEACYLGGGAGLFSPRIGRRRSSANRISF